jgi:hypothetical protein
LKKLGNLVFSGCTGLTEINLPAEVEVIGQDAFKNCSALVEIFIPSTATTIGKNILANCPALTAIYTSPGNEEALAQIFNDNGNKTYTNLISIR